jgi:hypothetical protein
MSHHQPSPGPSQPHGQPFQPAKQKSKSYQAVGIAAGAEDAKYQAKYKELKRKVKEIEKVSCDHHFSQQMSMIKWLSG